MENEVPNVEKRAGNRGKGRRPGVKNKATLLMEQFRRTSEAKGFKFNTGWEFLLWLMNQRSAPLELRLRAAQKLHDFERPRMLAVAAKKVHQHRVDIHTLLADRDIVKQMESLTFALGERKLLPAPAEPGGARRVPIDAEFTDVHPSATGS